MEIEAKIVWRKNPVPRFELFIAGVSFGTFNPITEATNALRKKLAARLGQIATITRPGESSGAIVGSATGCSQRDPASRLVSLQQPPGH
jgi:hypothetical protein